MLSSLLRGDLGLLLNAGGALLNGVKSVVVDTVCTSDCLAVVSAERGLIGPGHGSCRNARTERDLRVQNGVNLG